ncbi:MAG: methylamine utilization protein [Caulobacteraceae bacterium]|nr:methylamine utilization protein [Caulobacteraceae bacterium]
MRIALSSLAVSAAVLFAAGQAMAADLTVTIRDAKGKPVADAVVTAYPGGKTPAGPLKLAGPYKVIQQNLMFSPFVSVVPAGATVAFPNLDSVMHHVYSFSAAHPFEIKLYGKDQVHTVTFDKPGVIALGCNIHDQMVAFIKVVDTPYAAKSGADGVARLPGLPDGSTAVHIWHPYMKTKTGEIVQTWTLTGASAQSVSVDLRPPPPMSMGGY